MWLRGLYTCVWKGKCRFSQGLPFCYPGAAANRYQYFTPDSERTADIESDMVAGFVAVIVVALAFALALPVSTPTANRIGNQMLASTIEAAQPQAKQHTALQKFIIIRFEEMIKMGGDIYLFVFVQYPIILLIEKLG